MRRWLLALALTAFAAVSARAAEASKPLNQPAPAATGTIKPDPTALTLEQRLELNRQARILRARRCAAVGDILGWGKALFPHIFTLPFCHELHDYLVSIRHEEFTSTEAPRNHAKTTIRCFLIPLYQALNEPESYWHYLNVQATDEKALAINRSIKAEIEENAELREIYGDVRGSRWTDAQFAINVKGKDGRPIEVIFTAKSAGQSIRGIQYRQKRPDYIIVDDLYNEEDINNPEATEKKNAWFKGALLNCRAKSRRCSVSVQGTAINLQDLLEQHKKNAKTPETPEGRWVCRTFKAIKNWDTHEVLWSELNTWETLQQDLVDMGSIIFQREMQNERWDEVSAIIKRGWLYPSDGRPSWEFDPDDLRFTPDSARLLAVRIGNDPSVGEKLQNDYNAIAMVWVVRYPEDKVHRFYIVDLWNEHRTVDGRLELLNDVVDAQPKERRVGEARIEGIAGFKDYVALARSRVKVPVKEIDHVKDKITKRQLKSRYFENRRVFLSKRIAPKLKDELTYQLATNYPKHDDLADALFLTLDDAANWGAIL